MWHALFIEQIPFAEKVIRTVTVYALIALLFRLTGKRGLSNLSTFDVVVIFLLSNVVQNAIIGNDTSLTGGIVGAVTLVTVNALVNRVVASSATAARIFDGVLEPGGQLVLSLKQGEQSATKADVTSLHDQLSRIENLLRTAS